MDVLARQIRPTRPGYDADSPCVDRGSLPATHLRRLDERLETVAVGEAVPEAGLKAGHLPAREVGAGIEVEIFA